MSDKPVKRKRTTIGKGVVYLGIGIGVAAMAFLGFGSSVSQANQDAVVSVGDSKVSPQAYQSELIRTLDSYSQQTGTRISMQEAELVGLPQQVLQRLASAAALDEIGRTDGLRLGDRELAQTIATLPAFAGTDGAFSRDAYSTFLNRSGLSEREFEATFRDDQTRTILVEALNESIPSQENLAMIIAKKAGERRVANYIEVNLDRNEFDINAPDDTALRALYNDDAMGFNQPRGDELTGDVAYITAGSTTSDLSEDDIRAVFDANPEQYDQPEARTFLSVAFPNTDSANAALAEIDSGANSLESILASRGIDISSVTTTLANQDDLAGDISDIVFSATQNATVGPVQTSLGAILYNVTEIRPAVTANFENVRDQIARDLSTEVLRTKVDSVYDGALDAIAAGSNPTDLVNEFGFSLASDIPLTATDINGLGNDTVYLGAVLAAAPDDDVQLLLLDNGGLAAFQAKEQKEIPPLTFDEAREFLETAYYEQQRNLRLGELAKSIHESINSETTLNDAANNAGLTVSTPAATTQADAFEVLPVPIALELFEHTDGDVWTVDSRGAHYVVELVETLPFDEINEDGSALLTVVQTQVDDAFNSSAIQSIVNSAIVEHGSRTNPALIESVKTQIPR